MSAFGPWARCKVHPCFCLVSPARLACVVRSAMGPWSHCMGRPYTQANTQPSAARHFGMPSLAHGVLSKLLGCSLICHCRIQLRSRGCLPMHCKTRSDLRGPLCTDFACVSCLRMMHLESSPLVACWFTCCLLEHLQSSPAGSRMEHKGEATQPRQGQWAQNKNQEPCKKKYWSSPTGQGRNFVGA